VDNSPASGTDFLATTAGWDPGSGSSETVGLTVTATTLPGATVDVAVTGSPLGSQGSATTVTPATAGTDGSAAAAVELQPGTNSIEVATSAAGVSVP
jgi:hypothetical protein